MCLYFIPKIYILDMSGSLEAAAKYNSHGNFVRITVRREDSWRKESPHKVNQVDSGS